MSGSPDTERAVMPVLSDLVTRVGELVEDARKNGQATPEIQTRYRRKYRGFRYTESGPTYEGWSTVAETQESYQRAQYELWAKVGGLPEFKEATRLARANPTTQPRVEGMLRTFVPRLVGLYLAECPVDVESIVREVGQSWRDEPATVGVRAELEGLILEPENIQVSSGDSVLRLRQTVLADAETELFPFDIGGLDITPPSAMMEVTERIPPSTTVQPYLDRAIAALRLFSVSGVSYRKYTVLGASPADLFYGASFRPGHSRPVGGGRRLTRNDAERLADYWPLFYPRVPAPFYAEGGSSGGKLAVAYDYYCDSLLHGRSPADRISHAIMGLEALLHGGESEVAYTIKMRSAKLLAAVGYDPVSVATTVGAAYRVRSSYVHGNPRPSCLEPRPKKGDASSGELLDRVLEYLRGVVLVHLLPTVDPDALRSRADAAMLNRDADEQLRTSLRRFEPVVKPRG